VLVPKKPGTPLCRHNIDLINFERKQEAKARKRTRDNDDTSDEAEDAPEELRWPREVTLESRIEGDDDDNYSDQEVDSKDIQEQIQLEAKFSEFFDSLEDGATLVVERPEDNASDQTDNNIQSHRRKLIQAWLDLQDPYTGRQTCFLCPSLPFSVESFSAQSATLLCRHLQGGRHSRSTFDQYIDFCYSAEDKKWRCRLCDPSQKRPNGKRLDFKKHLEKQHGDFCEELKRQYVFD
jgi:hypothetical protein